jgi:hypothetical protein
MVRLLFPIWSQPPSSASGATFTPGRPLGRTPKQIRFRRRLTVTNQWHYHVLVVDQNLFGSFPSTVRNLTLTGKNSIVLQDNLNVISQAVINTTNLTINPATISAKTRKISLRHHALHEEPLHQHQWIFGLGE